MGYEFFSDAKMDVRMDFLHLSNSCYMIYDFCWVLCLYLHALFQILLFAMAVEMIVWNMCCSKLFPRLVGIVTWFWLQRIRKLIGNSKVRDTDAARLVMLYALRYEKHTNNDIVGLVDALKQRGVPEHLTKVRVNNTYILYQYAVHIIFLATHCIVN